MSNTQSTNLRTESYENMDDFYLLAELKRIQDKIAAYGENLPPQLALEDEDERT